VLALREFDKSEKRDQQIKKNIEEINFDNLHGA